MDWIAHRRTLVVATLGVVAVLLGLLVAAVLPGPRPAGSAGTKADTRVSAPTAARPASTPATRAHVFLGAGAWLDRYDQHLWNDPVPVLDRMQRAGVRTLYVQTGRSTERTAIKEPAKLDVILAEAHARDIAVVAWYLPYARQRAGRTHLPGGGSERFVDVRTDLVRSQRAIDYRSADGQHRFDGFALDIEPATGTDLAAAPRDAMLLDFSRQLRAHAGADYPLGAIVPPPVHNTGHARTSWTHFPWRGLAEHYDAWLPMLYFRQWQDAGVPVERGFRRDVELIRRETRGTRQLPVHIIGEVAADAGPTQLAQLRRAVRSSRAGGASLYDAASSDDADWRTVRRLATYFGDR